MVRKEKQESSVSAGGGARRFWSPAAEPMVVTKRDREMLTWVYSQGIGTREQLQKLFFSPGGLTRCQRRLTLLYRNRYLDKAPERAVNRPDVYYVSRRATKGLKLLRQLHPDQTIRPSTPNLLKLNHSLEVINGHLALLQACKKMEYTLLLWTGEEELTRKMQVPELQPDAYFQITRPLEGTDKKASFFLEVERSAKSTKTLREKYLKYGMFFYRGQYEAIFGAQALRILVLFGSEYGQSPKKQIARSLALCRQLQLGIVRFASLEDFLGLEPEQLLTAKIWHQPSNQEELCSLY